MAMPGGDPLMNIHCQLPTAKGPVPARIVVALGGGATLLDSVLEGVRRAMPESMINDPRCDVQPEPRHDH
jgi:hypothetical protein